METHLLSFEFVMNYTFLAGAVGGFAYLVFRVLRGVGLLRRKGPELSELPSFA